ncbi:hypothetical protein N0V88_007064 [Collariella sp. IMI 366227]|nr:hypothetical protein N0V88_007064 [Collariella sp. IMI 366227]
MGPNVELQCQDRDGLNWDLTGLDPAPAWAREPSLDAIALVCRRALALTVIDYCDITFHAEGTFNKVYLVHCRHGKLVLRVTLPVDPKNKTRSEWTRLQWIHHSTQIPVPKVIAFNDTQDDEIGFEWILMEFMPGVSAYSRWRKMSMDEKIRLVEQIATYQSQLFRSCQAAKFCSIGTLTSDLSIFVPLIAPAKPGPLVSHIFFCHNNFDYADAEDSFQLATELKALLPKIFPSLQHPPEPTALWHDDLSLSNILIDETTSSVTAIIDWECVSCQLLWVATEMPKFLDGHTREELPQRDSYADEYQMVFGGLDNEGKTEFYWDHLMEWEQTQLRKVYVARMKESWPQWEAEVEYGAVKWDFMGAVKECEDVWFMGRVRKWVRELEKGRFPRLVDFLNPPSGWVAGGMNGPG